MSWPRIRIRSLMVIIVIVGLGLAVVMLTRENRRLRTELAAERSKPKLEIIDLGFHVGHNTTSTSKKK